MPCVLTQGFTLDCRDSIGGVKAVWFIAHANVTAVTQASGVVTAITDTSNWYKYNLVKNTASLTENITGTVENGTVQYAPELNIIINKMMANTRNEILLLAQNTLMAIVQDQNNKYWLIGLQNGAISTLEDQDETTFNYIGELNNVSINNLIIDDLGYE
jgi:hypothetical protein